MEGSGYDVVGTWDAGGMGAAGGEGMGASVGGAQPWMFEGDFGSDSFWGFMNSYNP